MTTTGKKARKRSGTGGTRFAAKRAKRKKTGDKSFGKLKFSMSSKTAAQFVGSNTMIFTEEVAAEV